MKDLAYYNGKIGAIDEVSVPFCDRVHFFGDGVYEVTLARNHIIYTLHEHIDRFYRSASAIDIHIPLKKEELAELLYQLVLKVDSPDQLVYWQLTRGTHPRMHTYPEGIMGNMWVMLREEKPKDISKPVRAITAKDMRAEMCHVKSLNLIPAVLYSQKAMQAGVYETVLYRQNGIITECSHSNVHIINSRGAFQTAPESHHILAGIARANLIDACHQLGIEVELSPFNIDELMGAQDVIISSSTAPCFSCTEIDGISVGGKNPDTVNALRDFVMSDFITKTGG